MEKWAKRFIAESDLPLVEAAVKKAEGRTSGEIVPMIVRRSSSVGHVFWVVSLVLFTAYNSLLLTFDWHHHWPAWLTVALSILIVAAGYFLSSCSTIQRWFTPAADRHLQTLERSEIEFHRHGVGSTADRSAILIFLSLMEREAVVMADKTVAEKLPQSTWNEVINVLLNEVRSRRSANGLIKAIEQAGEILKNNFPRQSTDADELKNHLIIKE